MAKGWALTPEHLVSQEPTVTDRVTASSHHERRDETYQEVEDIDIVGEVEAS
ncbi:MAG TPA: hypothetical protein VKZ18_23420 [Polyangia bacterium]|nr:hypothetical protein [Polyangia bacterium]